MAKRPLNIILVGKTGTGKSSTGNFILGKKDFKRCMAFKSSTKEVHLEEIVQDGRTINVVDTPGLFDTDENLFETALKIQTSLKKVSPGPDAFFIVINASEKYTEESQMTQHIIQLTFGEKIFKHALIIFTHEDCIDSPDIVKDAESVKELQSLIQLCGGRCITLNNRSTDRNYITGKLKNMIEKVTDISKDGKVCYTEDITIYTEALKEQASKKIATKDLTLKMVATILQDAKNREKIAYAKGEASGLCKGLALGSVAAIGVLGVGAAALTAAVVKNPETAGKVLMIGAKCGIEILKNKRKCDNQDMHSNGICCGPPNVSESHRPFWEETKSEWSLLEKSPDKFI